MGVVTMVLQVREVKVNLVGANPESESFGIWKVAVARPSPIASAGWLALSSGWVTGWEAGHRPRRRAVCPGRAPLAFEPRAAGLCEGAWSLGPPGWRFCRSAVAMPNQSQRARDGCLMARGIPPANLVAMRPRDRDMLLQPGG